MNFVDKGDVDAAIWFTYQLSPITVQYVEKYKPLYSFLTSVSHLGWGIVLWIGNFLIFLKDF